MLDELAIALALIIGTGVIFIVLRGSSSLQPLDRKRQIKNRQQRREQARKEDSDRGDSDRENFTEEESGENERPGRDAILEWSGSE